MHVYKLDIIISYVIKCLLVYEENKELLDKYWTWKGNEVLGQVYYFGTTKDQEKDQQPPKHKFPLFLPKLDIIVILPMYEGWPSGGGGTIYLVLNSNPTKNAGSESVIPSSWSRFIITNCSSCGFPYHQKTTRQK